MARNCRCPSPHLTPVSPAPLLSPSLRLHGTWGYVLNDLESGRRKAAEEALAQGTDDPISRALIEQIDRSQADRLFVTEDRIRLRRGESEMVWVWQVLQEEEDALLLVLEGTDDTEERGEVHFEGRDWMSLVLGDEGEILEFRWRRISAPGPGSPLPPPARTP